MLSGYKTYVLAVLGGSVVSGYFLGYIDLEFAQMLLALLGFGGLVTLRSSIK